MLCALIAVMFFAPGDSISLTLTEAVRRANTQHLDIAAAHARSEQVAVGEEQAQVSLLPALSFQGKYTHNYKSAVLNVQDFFSPTRALAGILQKTLGPQNPGLEQAVGGFLHGLPQPDSVTIQKAEQLDASLTLAVPILAPAAWYNLWSAEGTTAAAKSNFQASRNRTLLAVVEAFYVALSQDEVSVARKQAVDVARVTVERAAIRFAAGTVKRTDVTQAELTLVQARQALVQAESARRQAYRHLATLLQLADNFVVVKPELPPDPANSDTLIESGAQHRPELLAYSQSLSAYQNQLNADGWRWWPTLSGFGNARVGNYAGFTGDIYAWSLGLQLDWSLYDGGARQAQAHLLREQIREAQLNLSAQQQSVRDDILNALDDLQTKRSGLTAAEDSQKLAAETLALIRVEYDSGTAIQLDVLQAQDDLVSADVALAQARFDLGLAWIVLRQATGQFPEDML